MSTSHPNGETAAAVVVLPLGLYTQSSTSLRLKASFSTAPELLHHSRTLPAIIRAQPNQSQRSNIHSPSRLNSFPLTSDSVLHPPYQHQNPGNPYNPTTANQHAESYERSTILQQNPNIVLARHSGPIRWSSASPQKDEFGLKREEEKERHELGFCGCASFEHVKEFFGRMMRRDVNGLDTIREDSEAGEDMEGGAGEEIQLPKIQRPSIPPLVYPEIGNKRWSV